MTDTYTGAVSPGDAPDVRELQDAVIRKISVGSMHNNAYLVTDRATGSSLLVDAAAETVAPVEQTRPDDGAGAASDPMHAARVSSLAIGEVRHPLQPFDPRNFAPGALTDVDDGTRDLSKVAYTLGAPKSDLAPGYQDEVRIDGVWYMVNGTPKDWTRGPYGFAPGVTVEVEANDG